MFEGTSRSGGRSLSQPHAPCVTDSGMPRQLVISPAGIKGTITLPRPGEAAQSLH